MTRLRRLILYLALRLNGVKEIMFGPLNWEDLMSDPEPSSPDEMPYHYEVAMSTNVRNKLLDVIRASDIGATQKRAMQDMLQLAERVPGTLKERLDWDKEVKLMKEWDKGLADFLKRKRKKEKA
jgi:hypothetical protein